MDNNFTSWGDFHNNDLPAHDLVDANGQIRFHHLGEGQHDKSEQVIQQLLDVAKKKVRPS